MKLNGKKYWIIGASEGLGRELAIQLSNLGVELVVSARNKVRLDELSLRTKAEVISLDVLDINSVRKAMYSFANGDAEKAYSFFHDNAVFIDINENKNMNSSKFNFFITANLLLNLF